MEENLILFDWDDTLFSKVEYKKNLRSNLARICEVSGEEIFRVEDEYFKSLKRSDDFQIENFVKSFENKFNKKINLENFSSDKLGIYSTALFPETIAVLDKLKKNGFKLGIYSQGFTSLQKIKIKSSGIKDYFDENFTFISRDKTDPEFIATLPNGATIIDDKKEEVLRPLNTTGRFDVVWLNRKEDEEMDNVTTVKNLNEFVKQLKPRKNKIVS
jgi:FMN phosphatase YigB (HAD superfamily)